MTEIKIKQYDNQRRIELAKREWTNMVHGKKVNKNKLPPIIYESWMRSLEYGVDPYKPLDKIISFDDAVLERLTSCEDLRAAYGEIIDIIQEMAQEMGLICRIANRDPKTVKILATPEILKKNIKAGNYFALDASEDLVGTNALCLAIKEKKPVQVLGPEHFNYFFHNIICTAAPIHDEKGEVNGVINISSNCIENTSIQTLGLAISIAKLLDNNLVIKKMLNDLTIKNETLYKIMEFLPSGIIYLNEDEEIEAYNQKTLDLLKINVDGKKIHTPKELLKHYLLLSCLDLSREFDNKEKLLKVGGKTESFLISNKKLVDQENQCKGCLVSLDSTNNIFKLHGSLTGNNAIYHFDDIKGKDIKLIKVKELAKKVADSNSALIIQGESGTGKEVLAQAIHNASSRRNRPFIGINCGAIPSELIESELFGYEAGAFTGALKGGKPGKLEIAFGGTVFLDEIESMPLSVQIKLLRVLSTNRIVKVGGTNEIPLDIRLISATKKDLLSEVEKGNFREDFFYRISIFTLVLPPLRERIKDIPILVDHFIHSFGRNNIKVNDTFYEVLKAYHWRGNIRELKNVIERALLLLGSNNELTIDHLPEEIINCYLLRKMKTQISLNSKQTWGMEAKGLIQIAEQIAIETAMKEKKGNLSKAANMLGISRSTLYKKLKGNI